MAALTVQPAAALHTAMLCNTVRCWAWDVMPGPY